MQSEMTEPSAEYNIVAVVTDMDNDVLIVGVFVSAGVLSHVIIPGLLVMWDRVLDHMGATSEKNF